MSYLIRPYLNTGFNVGFHSFRDFERALDRVFEDVGYSASRHFSLDESDDQYTLTLNLPGFKTPHVDVTLEKNVLTVKAKRDERSFEQSVIIPDDVDADKIEARLEDGVLLVVLGKSQLTKPRKIAIK